jgi:hypothetical protein
MYAQRYEHAIQLCRGIDNYDTLPTLMLNFNELHNKSSLATNEILQSLKKHGERSKIKIAIDYKSRLSK